MRYLEKEFEKASSALFNPSWRAIANSAEALRDIQRKLEDDPDRANGVFVEQVIDIASSDKREDVRVGVLKILHDVFYASPDLKPQVEKQSVTKLAMLASRDEYELASAARNCFSAIGSGNRIAMEDTLFDRLIDIAAEHEPSREAVPSLWTLVHGVKMRPDLVTAQHLEKLLSLVKGERAADLALTVYMMVGDMVQLLPYNKQCFSQNVFETIVMHAATHPDEMIRRTATCTVMGMVEKGLGGLASDTLIQLVSDSAKDPHNAADIRKASEIVYDALLERKEKDGPLVKKRPKFNWSLKL
jgi:hypothetical protein